MEDQDNIFADFLNIESAFDFGGADYDAPDISADLLGDFELDFGDGDPFSENRFMKPRVKVNRKGFVSSDNAQKLAKEIDYHRGDRVDCYVTGNFVFGDFIEAFLEQYNIKAKKMTICTLSMNEDNIGMLASLLMTERVEELNLLVSSYFYANERGFGGFIPLIQQTLGQDDRFQMAVASIHTKICAFETSFGEKIVIHGSANLRSSSNIEVFTIEVNPELYDWYDTIHDGLLERYKTINKEVRGRTLSKALMELDEEYHNELKQN